MKTIRGKKIICVLLMVVMMLSTVSAGAFATEGIEGGQGEQNEVQEQDVNKIISVKTVSGHQRIMLKWEVSDQTDMDGYYVDRYSENTGKWTEKYFTVEWNEGEPSETDGQKLFTIEDKDVGDGLIDSKTGKVPGGYFKYRIVPYSKEKITKYALTINYVNESRDKVADSYSANLKEGSVYEIPSPSVSGYELEDAEQATISGTIAQEDVTINVVYKETEQSEAGISEAVESTGEPVVEASSINEPEIVPYDKGSITSEKDRCVRTSYVRVTLKIEKKLTSHQTSGNKPITLKKGTKVWTCGFYSGKYVFVYDNHVYWLTRISTKSAKSYYTKNRVYSDEAAEYFVNKRGTDSGKYLIWVNTYSQRLYIFKGGKGNWELYKGPWKVSTGKASSPTIRTIDPKGIPTKSIHRGSYSIQKKVKKRHGIPYWNCISGYNAIHGKRSSWSINAKPKSGGCIRNTNDHAKWIYKNCSKSSTKVIVF